MRKIIIAILLIVPFTLIAQQDNFILKGKIGNLNAPAKIYLIRSPPFSGTEKSTIDSATIQNGQFEFKGSVNEPGEAFLTINREGTGLISKTKGMPDSVRSNEGLNVFLESGKIQINCPDSLIFTKAIITGSKNCVDFQKLQLALKTVWEQLTAYNADVKAMPNHKKNNEAVKSELKQRKKQIDNNRILVFSDYIMSNTNSYLSLYLVKVIYKNYRDYPQLALLFNALSEKLKYTEVDRVPANYLDVLFIKQYIAKLERIQDLETGKTILKFTQYDPNGKPIKLSDFRGKYLLIDFWVSSTYRLGKENPNVKTYANYHPKGLEILSVSLDTDKEKWIKAIKDGNLTWKHVSDLQGWKNDLVVLWGISTIPTNLLIGPKGEFIARDLKGGVLEAKLNEIFK